MAVSVLGRFELGSIHSSIPSLKSETDLVTDASTPQDAARLHPLDRLSLVEEMLDAALTALRMGTLELLIRQQPRAARWLMRPFMPLLAGSAGDELSSTHEPSVAAATLLRWLVSQLRPDQEPRLDRIDDEAWLQLLAWRPMLALMCHYRLADVPPFPGRYRRRADEAAVDNLCGLWDVGPSTFYRYVERAKHQMAQVALEAPASVVRRLALRRFVLGDIERRGRWVDDEARCQWHRQQAGALRTRGAAVSALWHALQARDGELAADILGVQAAALAGEPETDALVERASALPIEARSRVHLWLGRAALARTRNAVDRELMALDSALKLATETADPLLMGTAYAALARFHESRDADRAFACYDDSATYLMAADPQHRDAATVAQYMNTLVRLAWMHVLRNHPQAKTMLERADALRAAHRVPEDLVGMLEQSWGEYWRIAGDLPRALQAKHRALNTFERIGDQRSVLVTYLNLITLHGEARELERAEAYAQRVFEVARRTIVEPSILVSTHGNLAAAYVWADRYVRAIDEYQAALQHALGANLRLHANRTRMNLASAYYRLFVESQDAAYERLGDAELEAFFQAPATERTPSLTETARQLKAEALGARAEHSADRLLSGEAAEHLVEMAEIQRQRQGIAQADSPQQRARAHLAIAGAYLSISAKEREAARALAVKHQLGEALLAELDQLRVTFDRDLTIEQRLMAQWQRQAADLLDDSRRAVLIERLLRDGAINKSAYAEVCVVSPATASKHLAAFAERGLLEQTGKGPSTRYRLPS